VTDGFLRNVAKAAGVNADAALSYAKTPQAQEALNTADTDAQAVGADSTPTFTIKQGDGPEKILTVGLTDPSAALQKALAK
jgi:predicted DsbA family dithiol-disulfide isomerase